MRKRLLVIGLLIGGFVVATLLPAGMPVGNTVAPAHAVVAQVPEPGTLALLTVALGALAWWSSWKR